MSGQNLEAPPPELLARLADALQAGHSLAYALISPSLEIIWASPGFEQLLPDPAKRGEVLSQALPDLLWEFVGLESDLHAVLEDPATELRIERVNRPNPDQTTSYLNFAVLPYDRSDPGQALLLVVEDVTPTGVLEQQLLQERNELRLAQAELQRLNRLKSLFLSIAAHEIRAPLAAIAGFAGLLQADLSGSLSASHAAFLESISLQVEQINRLVEDFLQLDRLEQGRLEVHPVACDLNLYLPRVAAILRPAARDQNQAIETRLDENANLVLADPGRLEQILYNLLSNALKYTPPGGQILLRAWKQDRWGIFQVQDNGAGMSAEELAHLFELYYRSEQAQHSRLRGAGLGLYIVKSLVDAHQGQIQVSSQPGLGTAFTVSLPAHNGES